MPDHNDPANIQMPVVLGAASIGADKDIAAPQSLSGKRRIGEDALRWIFGACALLSVATTFGIIIVLVTESAPFFREVPILKFLTGREWYPQTEGKFGVLPLVCGTLLVTVGAIIFAVPLGLLSAIYLSEYASPRARTFLKPVLEVLAGVPSIVYGFFALMFITPLLQKMAVASTPLVQKVWPHAQPTVEGFNAMSASIAMAIMILPLVSSLCEDALHVVPRSLREGAYALGATKMEVSTQVVVPSALSGIAASFILAVSRAVGETMIVTLAAGGLAQITLNPFDSIQTMTAYIAQISMGDTEHGGVNYRSIFAVAVLLFIMTASMNLLSIALVKKYRQKYD
jgi:phosphate transport system permease protein